MYVLADDAVAEVTAALPAELLVALAELRAALGLAPWSIGDPLIPSNPHGVRVAPFGPRGRAQLVWGVLPPDVWYRCCSSSGSDSRCRAALLFITAAALVG